MSLLQIFDTQGRLSRRNFIFINACGYLIFILIFISLMIVAEVKILTYIFFVILALYAILLSIILKKARIKRLHDLGYHKSSYKNLYIPFSGEFLSYRIFLEKGQILDNEYGSTTWTKKELLRHQPSLLKKELNKLTIEKAKHLSNSKKKSVAKKGKEKPSIPQKPTSEKNQIAEPELIK